MSLITLVSWELWLYKEVVDFFCQKLNPSLYSSYIIKSSKLLLILMSLYTCLHLDHYTLDSGTSNVLMLPHHYTFRSLVMLMLLMCCNEGILNCALIMEL